MSSADLFEKKIVRVGLVAQNATEAISSLADVLLEHGYVNQEFKEAILAREAEYPTGLPTEGVGVAIPHTDIQYVINPAVAIAVLSAPVSFEMMGMPEQNVDVQILFMLALNDPDAQIGMLQSLMEVIQQPEFLYALKDAQDEHQVMDVLSKWF